MGDSCCCCELIEQIFNSNCNCDCSWFDSWTKDMCGKNGYNGSIRCKTRLEICKMCFSSTENSTADTAAAVAAAGIVIGGVTYIGYDKDKIKVHWDKVIDAINTLNWNKLSVDPHIPPGVVLELEVLYYILIETLKKNISEKNIWIIMKLESGIKKEKLLQISNSLIPPKNGQQNFFSKKIQQMYPNTIDKSDTFIQQVIQKGKQKFNELGAFSTAAFYSQTIKAKLKKKMEDNTFIKEIKDTYKELISFIKQQGSIKITYPGLDRKRKDHTVYITTDDIYYKNTSQDKISFFNLLENKEERETFKINYEKVFQNQNMFGVPEEQIMLRF